MQTKSRSGKIRPLIKWTGGKYSEYKEFSSLIPPFNRYIEPFFGGGGVFFALQTDKISYLNDRSKDLIDFYKSLSDNDFRDQAFIYADAWGQTEILKTDILKFEPELFSEFISQSIDHAQLNERLKNIFIQLSFDNYAPLFDESFILDPEKFVNVLSDSIADKFRRIRSISEKEGRIFTKEELEIHFETGLRSGIYLYLRKIMNDVNRGSIHIPNSKAIANWYFVREFCYASMFRFNSKGEFNIPYGGIAYNRKNFRSKIQQLFRPEVTSLFSNSQITNLDFEEFLDSIDLCDEDFIFLDPPYDSEFSEYDQNSFNMDDQRRLAEYLKHVPSKWMMVIKETPFIRSLYKGEGLFLLGFNKNYSYNVRGRNKREAKHLIILNYDPA